MSGLTIATPMNARITARPTIPAPAGRVGADAGEQTEAGEDQADREEHPADPEAPVAATEHDRRVRMRRRATDARRRRSRTYVTTVPTTRARMIVGGSPRLVGAEPKGGAVLQPDGDEHPEEEPRTDDRRPTRSASAVTNVTCLALAEARGAKP
jgi:hypothetical protein